MFLEKKPWAQQLSNHRNSHGERSHIWRRNESLKQQSCIWREPHLEKKLKSIAMESNLKGIMFEGSHVWKRTKSVAKTCTIAWRWGFQIGESLECLQNVGTWRCFLGLSMPWPLFVGVLIFNVVTFHPLLQGVWTNATSSCSFPSTIPKMAWGRMFKNWIPI
jgi:hypothetical protein